MKNLFKEICEWISVIFYALKWMIAIFIFLLFACWLIYMGYTGYRDLGINIYKDIQGRIK